MDEPRKEETMFLTSFSGSERPRWRMLAVLCFAFALTAGCIVADSTDDEAAEEAAVETEQLAEEAPATDEAARDGEPERIARVEEPDEDRGFFDRVFDRGPVAVTVPAGTSVAVRMLDTASSHESTVGQTVSAEVVNDVTADGEVAIPAGSTVIGEVSQARQPGIGGQAWVAVDFVSVELPSGDSAPFSATVSAYGKSERGKDVATIVGGTAAGAILGHQVEDDDEGKVIGGIVGGGIGTAIARGTKGKPAVLPAGTVVDLTLEGPVTVEVAS
jgi:hypothetical protein